MAKTKAKAKAKKPAAKPAMPMKGEMPMAKGGKSLPPWLAKGK